MAGTPAPPHVLRVESMDVEAAPGGLRPPLTSPAADAGTAVDASFSLREFLLFLGPGLLVAVAFMVRAGSYSRS